MHQLLRRSSLAIIKKIELIEYHKQWRIHKPYDSLPNLQYMCFLF